ncbi:MAG: hypothetical protein HZRFUVUK_001226 [Candidatus Fervidibacterota bacterium]
MKWLHINATEMSLQPPLQGKRLSNLLMAGLFLCAVASILVLRWRYFMVVEVTSNSMFPTLLIGDRILFLKDAYRRSDPHRGDIVVLRRPNGDGELTIKRVVGLQGEVITAYGGKVYINGKPLDEPYIRGVATAWIKPTLIPEGHVYLLGDNRPSSEDSRDFGPVPVKSLLGRALLRVLPIDRFGRVH